MNVTIVQGAFLPMPPLAGGAVEKLWFDLGREFARRGLAVTHVSRAWPGLPERGALDGVQHARVAGYDYPASRLLAKAMDLLYSLRCLRVLPPADVVVTNTFFLPLLLPLLRRGAGVVYVSVHRYPQGQMGLYRGVARLQCVSSAVADAVRAQAPALAARVKVVPNYVAGWRDAAEVAACWPQRRREVLYVGRVHPEKGLDLLLRAYAAVAPALRAGWRLAVVGPHAVASGGGGDAYLESLRRLAAALGIEVEWAGPVFDRDALNARYARSRVFVYPSTAARGEAFPLAPLEAMAQGCAVLTSDLRCFDDYLEPGRNADRFELAGDAAAQLGRALQSLLGDEARQRRYAQAGLATAQRFGLARVADAFVDDFAALRRGGPTR